MKTQELLRRAADFVWDHRGEKLPGDIDFAYDQTARQLCDELHAAAASLEKLAHEAARIAEEADAYGQHNKDLSTGFLRALISAGVR